MVGKVALIQSEWLVRLQTRAEQLLRSGPLPDAIDAYERLLAEHEDLADSWYNLGYLKRRAGDFSESLACYRKALKQGIDSPEEIHLNCAVIFAEDLRETDLALQEIDAALKLNPSYVPALLNLGNINEQKGIRDRALDAYKRVLTFDPTNAIALSRLPDLLTADSTNLTVIERLEDAIRGAKTNDDKADLGFALGKALDNATEYSRAFAAYCAANRASRLSALSKGLCYRREVHEKLVDQLIAAFPKRLSGKPVVSGIATPVFICGMFRSGSSLVEQVMASHPRVCAGGELDLLPRIARQHLLPFLDKPSLFRASADLAKFGVNYRASLSMRFPEAEFITDKRPDNFFNIGLIKMLFPDAKVVYTSRHSVDNCLSVFFLHLSHTMPFAFDLLDIAHWFRQHEKLMMHWKSLYGDDIHEVNYDTLVKDFQPTVQQLLAYCGLPWDDACSSFHNTESVIMTPSAWQVRQPLYTRSSGRWLHYKDHLESLCSALS